MHISTYVDMYVCVSKIGTSISFAFTQEYRLVLWIALKLQQAHAMISKFCLQKLYNSKVSQGTSKATFSAVSNQARLKKLKIDFF